MHGRALVAMCIAVVGCLPSEDLKSYTEGSSEAVSATGAGPTPGPSTGETAPAAVPEPAPAASALDAELQPPTSLDPGEADGASDERDGPVVGPPTANADGADPDEEIDTPPDAPGTGLSPVDADPPPANEAPVTRPQFRFVRLVADSAVQGTVTSVAELNVLDGAGQVIDRVGWVASADSEETVFVGGAPARLAIDGVAASIWHTAWFQVNPPPPHPHTLEVDMGALHEVSGFRYLGRQDGPLEGRIANYRLFLSADGIEWGEPAVSGTLDNSSAEQEVRLSP